MPDQSIQDLINFISKIKEEKLSASDIEKILQLSKQTSDIGILSKKLLSLNDYIIKKVRELNLIFDITTKINNGLVEEEIFNNIYDTFKELIPYDRIGMAFLEEENSIVKAYWYRSESKNVQIQYDYKAKLQGSSLQKILEKNEPRIINNLKKYLEEHPSSFSTKKIVKEGILSNLTCPLIISNKPIGFIFFSSMNPDTYQNLHIQIFKHIAAEVSMIIEKSRLYQKLKELNDLKNKFIGMAAHDLRSPIAIIKGNTELMEQKLLGDISDKQKESLQTIKKTSQRMLNLINAFLDVSVIESGTFELKKEKTDTLQFLKECYEFNKLLAKSKNIQLNLEIPKTLPSINLDKERIAQVINNLITNALKFSEPNSTVILKALEKDKNLHIIVSDQGRGIALEEIPHLFEFFTKTSTKPTGKESSTGLGLAICKKIIDAHKGKIWAEKNPDKGMSFIFSLPIE